MDLNNIMNLMGQQAKVLKELEDLIAHDAKEAGSHSVNPKDLDVLKTYVSTMKTAVDTATTLAKHYKVAGATRTEQPAQEAKLEIGTPDVRVELGELGELVSMTG
ncbi:MAG: hypothetical protein AB1815_02680 [Bacillota bacterium]